MYTENNIKSDFDSLVDAAFDDLIKTSERLQKPESFQKVKYAFEFARKAHIKQFRKTGLKLPYILHPLAVAKIIAFEMGLGSTTVVAALLHDVVEDTEFTDEDIEREFGKEVLTIVQGVTKSEEIIVPGRSKQADTFRHFILKMSEDKRIAFVKIADRLHNLRTIDEMPENNKMIKTAESLEIYAPLAHQLGLFSIKKEIEDLSFKNRFPEEYNKIKQIVDINFPERQIKLNQILEPLHKNLEKYNYNFHIDTITKSYYRTWKIITDKQIKFEDIYNYITIRIVINPSDNLPEKQQCFLVYSMLTDVFLVKDSKLKDWITHPKTNGFEAIITDVMFGGHWHEVQIMTDRMNQIAQRGYARNHDNIHLSNVKQWINSMGEILGKKNLSNDRILELIKPQDSEIYVITPKGDQIILKKGATVLDYAFTIHTDLGFHFVAAEVDKKTVSYDYILSTGEQIKILTDENSKPEKIWKKSLKIPKNQDILAGYFKKIKRNMISEGEIKFNYVIEKYKLKEDILAKFINVFRCKNKEEFYFRLSIGRIKDEDIAREITKLHGFTQRIFGLFTSAKKIEPQKLSEIEFSPKAPFVIESLDNISLAVCCHPLEGDKAIVHKKDSRFIIHRADCKKAKLLNSSEGQNTTNVVWQLAEISDFRAKIEITGLDRKGLLSDIIDIISSEMDINMKSLIIKSEKNLFIGIIELFIKNSASLNRLITKISNVKDVQKVYRAFSFK
jgi:GTP pyrophosphokinase